MKRIIPKGGAVAARTARLGVNAYLFTALLGALVARNVLRREDLVLIKEALLEAVGGNAAGSAYAAEIERAMGRVEAVFDRAAELRQQHVDHVVKGAL